MKVIKITLVSIIILIANNLFAGDDAKALIQKAEELRLKAAQAGFEWTTTKPLINKAKAAVKKGDKQLAIEYASKALRQGENAIIQAEYAEKHWQDTVPK